MAQIVDITCPGCGARVAISQKDCIYCHQPVVITTFNDIKDMAMPQLNKYAGTYKKALAEEPDNQQLNYAIGMCFMRLKMYDKALAAFELAMVDDFDNAETFFYAAICILKGRKPFLCLRPDIDKMIEYVNAALMIEERGLFYYFLAYIKKDYFARKAFRVTPNYMDMLAEAKRHGFSRADVNSLFALIGQQNTVES